MATDWLLLILPLLLVAVLYGAAGHGRASGYLAVLALAGVAPVPFAYLGDQPALPTRFFRVFLALMLGLAAFRLLPSSSFTFIKPPAGLLGQGSQLGIHLTKVWSNLARTGLPGGCLGASWGSAKARDNQLRPSLVLGLAGVKLSIL
jgi:hypothetical protein